MGGDESLALSGSSKLGPSESWLSLQSVVEWYTIECKGSDRKEGVMTASHLGCGEEEEACDV